MATRRRIGEAAVQQFFVRENPPPTPQPLQLEAAFVVPFFHVQRAFDSTGAATPDALLDPDYHSGFQDAEELWATAPGMPQGATLDSKKTDVYAVFGDGESPTVRRLRQENDEDTILSLTSGVVLGKNDTVAGYPFPVRTVQFPGADFSVLLAGYSFPDFVTKQYPNFLEDQVLFVVVDSAPDMPLVVAGIDSTDPSTLILYAEVNVPDGTVGASLISNLRQIDFYVSGRKAQAPVAGNTITSVSATTVTPTSSGGTAGTVSVSSYDRYNEWIVSFTTSAPDTPLNVSSDLLSPRDGTLANPFKLDVILPGTKTTGLATIATIGDGVNTFFSGTLTGDLPIVPGTVSFAGGGGSWADGASDGVLLNGGAPAADGTIDYLTGEWTVNFTAAPGSGTDLSAGYSSYQGSLDELNAAIESEFVGIERSKEAPIRIESNDSNVYITAGFASTAIAAMAQSWVGTVEAVSAGDEGNGYDVTVQSGASASPVVNRSGDHWIISIGTTSGNNTVDAVNALLLNEGNLIQFTTTGDSSTDLLTVGCLGIRKNHLGYIDNVWRGDSTVSLAGGMSDGGIDVYGGLLPYYEADDPTAVSVPLYAEYRALRVDASASASSSTTGNRPALTELHDTTWESIVGEPDTDNPASIAASEYFAVSRNRRMWLLSPSSVTDDYPWGTEDAVDDALDFLQKRDVYHVYVFNDALFIPQNMVSTAEGIGGSGVGDPLKRPQIFYYPLKTPSLSLDVTVVTGTDATLVPTTNDLVASQDFVAAGVTAGTDVIVFSDAGITGGDVTLADGRVGFTITATGVGGSPFRITLTAVPGGSFSSGGEAFTVLTPGTDLSSSGVYDSQTAAESMADYYSTSGLYHKRVNRQLVDSYEALIDGTSTTLDGVYLLAELAALVSNSPDHLPVTSLEYSNANYVQGTSDMFNGDQLEILAGAGIILPVQRSGSSEGPTYVFRDVSSDVSTRTFQRRTAGVSEDALTIEIDRTIRPRLGPNLVTESFLDRIAMDVSRIYDNKRRAGIFKVLDLVNILPITDEVRAAYGTDESGILILSQIRHLEEAVSAIVEHTVSPG